jgi:GTP-binding protein LepA
MVFDSHYDRFRGAITYLRVMNGVLRKGERVRMMRAGTTHEVMEVGHFVPQRQPCPTLSAGQVGYVICNIKSIDKIHVGETVAHAGDLEVKALPGYQAPKRMVYCGLFPSEGQDFEELRDALNRLAINDPSFEFEPESSEALGFGFRCGFLGLLHMEIVQQRLEQESDVDLVQTAPNVTYEIVKTNGETVEIHRPQEVPDLGQIKEFRQPIVRVNLVQPSESIGTVMKLCQDRRGVLVRTEYLSPTRAMLTYDLPLAEVIYDLHDKLKSATRGYGTMDYEFVGYQPADLVRLDILVNGSRVDALSVICDRRDADRRGRAVVKKLKSEIDRHMFEIAVQAAIGSRVIARETVPAMRKNVTAKCYGGDITRKRKLWAKQREGKKRMKSIGQVDIPQKAFMAVLETGEDKR